MKIFFRREYLVIRILLLHLSRVREKHASKHYGVARLRVIATFPEISIGQWRGGDV